MNDYLSRSPISNTKVIFDLDTISSINKDYIPYYANNSSYYIFNFRNITVYKKEINSLEARNFSAYHILEKLHRDFSFYSYHCDETILTVGSGFIYDNKKNIPLLVLGIKANIPIVREPFKNSDKLCLFISNEVFLLPVYKKLYEEVIAIFIEYCLLHKFKVEIKTCLDIEKMFFEKENIDFNFKNIESMNKFINVDLKKIYEDEMKTIKEYPLIPHENFVILNDTQQEKEELPF